MQDIKKQRLPLWRAFSELFLDTELQEYTYKYIARTINESELSIEEAEKILWNEVYPVLEANLQSIAGNWSGWPDDWLLDNLEVCSNPNIELSGRHWIIKEIHQSWHKISEYVIKARQTN